MRFSVIQCVKKLNPMALVRQTHGSHLAMCGVPMGVVAAQLGHADTRMTEKHYAHLAPSYVAQTIRANFPRLHLEEDTKVVRLPAQHG
jgi:site-specific recombinase XerD